MSKSKKEDEKLDETKSFNANDDIAQPDPNAEDSQGYIKENAKKGEPVFVPNVIGPNPITHPVGETEAKDDAKKEK